MAYQHTLRSAAYAKGVGLHSGMTTKIRLLPAPIDFGRVFVRVDRDPPISIPAEVRWLTDTTLATTLGRDGVVVGTVEHLLAALVGLGIDNVRIELDGSEVPILDGSARLWVERFQEAGIVSQPAVRRILVVTRTVEITDGDRRARLEPCSSFCLSSTIDFDHPLVRRQALELEVSEDAFIQQVAPARTFGFAHDIETMQRAGHAKGGSLDNALVIDDFSIRNSGGLRFADEPVRHKLLDAMGDLSLLGAPLLGRYSGFKSGHTLNTRLMKLFLQTSEAYEHRVLSSDQASMPAEADPGRLSLIEFGVLCDI